MGNADQHLKRRHEAPEIGAMIGRCMRSLSRRAGEGDTEALEQLAQLQATLSIQLHLAAVELHQCGYSWQAIGDLMGVTRQAAQQRFGGTP